jgi:hypothetical protein
VNQRSLILFVVELAMALWAEAYRNTDKARKRSLACGLLRPTRKWCWSVSCEVLFQAQVPSVHAGANHGIGLVRNQPVLWRRVL